MYMYVEKSTEIFHSFNQNRSFLDFYTFWRLQIAELSFYFARHE